MNERRRLLWPKRWTLRARLTAALLALLAAVSVVIGVVSVSALHKQVLDQVDHQLTAASGRSINAERGRGGDPGPPPLGGDGGPDLSNVLGQPAGTLVARLVNGQFTSAGITQGGVNAATPLDAADKSRLAALPADSKPHTISVDQHDEYRAIAIADPDGDGSVVVTGLPLNDANSTVYNLALVITIVSLAGLAGAGLLGSVIVRLALRPLRRVTETAARVSELPLDRGEVALSERVPAPDTDTRTEVGQVGAALNTLLGHVATALTARQASEVRVRQFVADASHELRTPLASIRGYAELTRRTRDELPSDVSHALQRVESEATRMTGLVDDLLLLARLDAGRPIERVPVDLTALAINAVSDAHAAGPDHPVDLRLPDEPVEIIGDPARLHQVLTNLLSNARTHTPAGTAVTLTLRSDGDDVTVEVADRGPGIDAKVLPHIFERFARGDSSRSRTAGSTGLGLAIVAAVVAAHGGTVDARSRPGLTCFQVRLPLPTAKLPESRNLVAR